MIGLVLSGEPDFELLGRGEVTCINGGEKRGGGTAGDAAGGAPHAGRGTRPVLGIAEQHVAWLRFRSGT